MNKPMAIEDEDEQLQSLFTKERETSTKSAINQRTAARKEAVEWILKINAHYGFSPLTSILAVNYLDRFISSLRFSEEKPWMMQLAAVTCLSLAAKVEETHVPLLLDLQVDGTKFVFEAKTIQKMELLVLSGLKWRMNPVTPLSFLDHMIKRVEGLKSFINWDFIKSCENLILSVISDPRFTLYLPSVLAISTMLHVVHHFESCDSIDYENQLLGLLKISKEEVDECYEVISEVISDSEKNNQKRKFRQENMDEDSSNESWDVSSCITSSLSPPFFKKVRSVAEHHHI